MGSGRDGARHRATAPPRLTPPKDDSMSATPDTAAIPSKDATKDARATTVDMKLEVVAIPVSDVDRAKEFYGRLGWRLDADFTAGGGRVVQFTPPGSQCSVHFGKHITGAPIGTAQ